MREKIEKMIETDYILQKLFMTENPERIDFFETNTPHPAPTTQKTSASSSARSSTSKVSSQQPQQQQPQQQQQQQQPPQQQRRPSGLGICSKNIEKAFLL
jgi:hypothetical protein